MRVPDAAIAVVVGFAVVILILALRPIAGMPMNDDFSYSHSAAEFVRTGHIVYNGWGSPIILPQIWVGALLFRLFGTTYVVTQWFGTIVAGIAAGVLFRFCTLCGLSRRWALLTTALTVLNPIYLGVAPSFMTDIPSLLLLLLALYALVMSLRRAAGAGSVIAADGSDVATTSASDGVAPQMDRAVVADPVLGVDPRWLALSVLLGVVAGSNRQICWIAFVGALFAVAALVPRARLGCAIGIVVVLASAALGTRWFDHQPYTVPADANLTDSLNLFAGFPAEMLIFISRVVEMIGLFVLAPASAAFLLGIRSGRPIRGLLLGAIAVFCFLPILHPLSGHKLDLLHTGYHLTMLPYAQYFTHVGSVIGAVHGWWALPAAFGPSAVIALVVAGTFGMTVGGYLLVDWLESAIDAKRKSSEGCPFWVVAASIAGTASLFQILASLPWFAFLNMFDRYMVLQVPGLLILHAAQAQAAARAPVAVRRGAVCSLLTVASASLVAMPTLVIAFFGVVFAHDYFATDRARAVLYRRVLTHGIAPSAIDAGFEWDADEQVRIAGHINNPHVINPPGTYHQFAPTDGTVPFYIQDDFPTMRAQYMFSTIAPDEIDPTLVFPSPPDKQTFRTLLPCGERTIYIYPVRPQDSAPPDPSATPTP
jgi:hypothetical protein